MDSDEVIIAVAVNTDVIEDTIVAEDRITITVEDVVTTNGEPISPPTTPPSSSGVCADSGVKFKLDIRSAAATGLERRIKHSVVERAVLHLVVP